MHTEGEAKTRWCPFARAVYIGDSGIQQAPSNRFATSKGCQSNPEEARCIGSACMAWRWGGHRSKHDPRISDGAFSDIKPGESDRDLTAIGYCGLAGKADVS